MYYVYSKNYSKLAVTKEAERENKLLIIQLLRDLPLLLPRSEDLGILGVEYFSHSPMLSLY